MSNRAGKREREARSRHKRCVVTRQIGGVVRTLKLAHKKDMAALLRRLGPREIVVHDYSSPRHLGAPWAVPVDDSRTPVKKDE